MNEFQTVYEVTNETIKLHWLLPVGFVLLASGILWYNIKFKDKIDSGKRFLNIILFSLFGVFFLVISILVVPYQIGEYIKTKNIIEKKQYKTIEGEVKKYALTPSGGTQIESFVIDSIKFEYDYLDESHYGFNQTRQYGGPIDSGLIVRIDYYSKDGKNIILKLEIKK